MTWRDPNTDPAGTLATCDSLRELAAAYSPLFYYDLRERCFPVLAESWLSHTTAAPWTPEEREADDLPVDDFKRGTAIMESASAAMGAPQHRGGPPNAFDRPIQLTSVQADADSIGGYAGVDARTFLNFAGWRPDSDFRAGDENYLYDAFSELSGAMQAGQRWNLLEGRPNVPHLWVPQPPNPTVYAEVEWGGMYLEWSRAPGAGDFPVDGVPELEQMLVLTYYYLYAMREPPPDGGVRRLEGQWEAVSLLFPCTVSKDRNADGRPVELTWTEPPAAIVISKNVERSADTPLRQHPNEVQPWTGTFMKVHCHPVLFVGAGTHRHFFLPGEITFNASSNPPPGNSATTTGGGGEFPGVEMWLLWSIVIALALPLIFGPLALAAPWLIALIALIALALFIAWLVSLIQDAINQASGDPLPPSGNNEEAGGGGPVGGGGGEPPAGGSTGPDPTATQPPGTPNAGSPTGRDIVSFDIRVIDLLHHAGDRTAFPSADQCEHPHWWDYSGSWGINVRAPSLEADWESGTQRVDELHRSWGYWNALRFATSLNGGSTGP